MRIGIDPGLNGAIAFVYDDRIEVEDMPTMIQPWSVSDVRMVDGVALYQMLDAKKEEMESITIEIVHTMPKQGVVSSGRFMGAFYTAVSISRLFLEPKMVLPSQWKKHFGLINMPKDASRLAVLKMYPNLIPLLKRKKDVDRAEAIMIAVS